MSEAILRVEGLKTVFHHSHGKVLTAVDDVSFDLYSGEVFGIIGESGSGKSVTCRSILRLIQHPGEIVAGRVLYRGRDILKLPHNKMHQVRGQEIAMIFQDPMVALNPVHTVRTQLYEALRANEAVPAGKGLEELAIGLLRSVGIPAPEQRINDYPYRFSGGMAQRVVIAIALAADPSVLLADEPTSALDVTIQDQILKLLLRLQSGRSMSMILVTHSFGVVAQTCDRVAVMYAGQLVEVADVETIFYSPRHPYTIGLLNCVPDVGERQHERLTPIPGIVPDLINPPTGCRFHPRCPLAIEECRQLPVSLVNVSATHQTACIRHQELVETRNIYTV
jgi:oligopeptide/dipeptide ABC transporter ATP-binding protein